MSEIISKSMTVKQLKETSTWKKVEGKSKYTTKDKIIGALIDAGAKLAKDKSPRKSPKGERKASLERKVSKVAEEAVGKLEEVGKEAKKTERAAKLVRKASQKLLVGKAKKKTALTAEKKKQLEERKEEAKDIKDSVISGEKAIEKLREDYAGVTYNTGKMEGMLEVVREIIKDFPDV